MIRGGGVEVSRLAPWLMIKGIGIQETELRQGAGGQMWGPQAHVCFWWLVRAAVLAGRCMGVAQGMRGMATPGDAAAGGRQAG